MAKVLFVEDDLDLQRIYTEKLKLEGFDVILAANASTALNYIKNDKPNLILLDIMIPGTMNGFELLEIIKQDKDNKNIPIIVLTNLDTEKEQALQIGANDYLIKANTSLPELVEKVKKLAN